MHFSLFPRTITAVLFGQGQLRGDVGFCRVWGSEWQRGGSRRRVGKAGDPRHGQHQGLGWMRARHLGTWGRGRSAASPSSPWKGRGHPKDLRRCVPERCPAAFPAPFFPTSPHLRIEPEWVSAPCSSCDIFFFSHNFSPGGPVLFRISH